ncbi:MAG: hypothetical protein ACD_69C00155G0002 [uncultured bacterium]|nr:MAG: hypothetical protein ACD_69C00155G0002 [uncultured bacterium]OGT09189.1 MAG: hypothetical protein A2V89_00620 [Gammaproteobacteria bacterium RBG_16_37_9]HBS52316.1 hypothetical protein [Coxiellaceae bacterium]
MESKKYFSLLEDLNINYYRVIHGLKTAVACLVGLAIEKYYDWPSGQWVPITIMVVMSAQIHFGGALRKAYMRFLGTVSGVTIVVTVLWFFGGNLEVVFYTVFLASIIFAYIASSHGDISYAGTLGGVTIILILAGQQTGIEIAIQRGFYIVIGIIIALLFSRFIFPIHARDRLRYHVSRTLLNLSKLYSESINLQDLPEQTEEIDTELSSIVIADIAAQPRLIYEAIAGSREFASKKGIFSAILSSEHTLSRLINLLYLSLRETESPEVVKAQLAAVESLHAIVAGSLTHLAKCFEDIAQPQMMFNLGEALAKISQVVEKLPKSSNAQQVIAEHSFLFFIEQILKELENMRKLIIEANSKNHDNVV